MNGIVPLPIRDPTEKYPAKIISKGILSGARMSVMATTVSLYGGTAHFEAQYTT
jgi:hypothetical protein